MGGLKANLSNVTWSLVFISPADNDSQDASYPCDL